MAVAARQSEETVSGRERLLEAAGASFAVGGYAGTSIAEIARAAEDEQVNGVSPFFRPRKPFTSR